MASSQDSGMMRDLRAMYEVLALSGLRFPGQQPRKPLEDDTPDPGLFGPDSITWRVAREPSLAFVGGQRALLMQVADPLIGQAVLEHSDFVNDPYRRLLGTLEWLMYVTFGTEAEAREATRRVAAIHGKVRGVLPVDADSSPYPRGSAYDAKDPALAIWVLATIVQSALLSYEAVVHPLSTNDRDAFVGEWAPVAELFAIPRKRYWQSAAALDDYIDVHVSEIGSVSDSSRKVARGVMGPGASVVLRPMIAGTRFISLGLTPPKLRRAYGFRWTQAHQRGHDAACLSLRTAHHAFPRLMRVSPIYDQAVSRVSRAA